MAWINLHWWRQIRTTEDDDDDDESDDDDENKIFRGSFAASNL